MLFQPGKNDDQGNYQVLTIKCIRSILIAALFLSGIGSVHASSDKFASIELFELAMNNGKKYAGEVGYRIDEKYQIRFTFMDILLTERHLASDTEAYAIDGNNVKGIFKAYEFNLDRFITKRIYASINYGYHENRYTHTVLQNSSVGNSTATIGTGIGYFRKNLFGFERAYLNLNMPIRYYVNELEETRLGDATVRPHVIVNNLWLFVGVVF